MRHVMSDQIGDFVAFYDEDVELVSVTRPQSPSLETLANRLFASRRVLQKQWEQAATDADLPSRILDASVEPDYLPALAEEVTTASEILKELLGCDRVGVRITTLSSPMCPRFHADQIPCRMLMTIKGPATEWIASDDVNQTVLADRSSDETPIRNGREIQHLTEGSWALLKGATWQDQYQGVVHRSPHQPGERLLLSIDPLFPA